MRELLSNMRISIWSMLVLAMLVPGFIYSQTGAGIIRGTVVDSNQAVVPGAKVTATNSRTNFENTSQTNEVGIFYFGALQPGPYKVIVELSGFKKWEATLTLGVGQTAVLSAALELGSVETTIEVVGAAPVITTESAEVANVKDAQRIQQLPLNGRQVSQLFNLTPGVEGSSGAGETDPNSRGSSPRVNGMKVGSTEMLVDGVSIVDRFGGGIARIQPGLDTVQEFRIETAGSSARYSRPATITLLSKSGTNEFHGSAFETHRNNAAGLRARTRQDGNEAAKLIRNEFGVSGGGPVIKNKTFWFAAYEGLRQREAAFTQNYGDYNVPTAAMWRGDFSGLQDLDGNAIHIYDPLTTDANGVRKQFPGDIIPASRISNIFKTVQAITDDPTGSTNPFQGPNHIRFYPKTQDQNVWTFKGDHKFSDKDNIAVRYTQSKRPGKVFGGVYGAPKEGSEDAFGSSLRDYKTYNSSIQYNRIFSPTFINELVLAGHYSDVHYGTLADYTDWPNKLGLPNPFGAKGWPTFYTYESSYNGYFGWDADNLNDQKLTGIVAEDNVTLIKGKHTMRFGGKFRPERNNVRELQQSQGSHTFAQDWTAQYDAAGDQAESFTGSGLAAMALGLPTYLSNQYNRGYFYFQQKEIGLYFADNFKVTPRLTLDLGLRWDKWTPYKEKYDRLVNVDIDNLGSSSYQVITPHSTRVEDIQGIPSGVLNSWAANGLSWKTADAAGFPGSLLAADNNNFGPRIGAAFKLDDKTVLRGSYGEYFWTMPLSQILQSSRSNPPLNLRFSNQISTDFATGSSTVALRTVPKPEFYVGKAQVDVNGTVIIPPYEHYMVPLDGRRWKDGRSQTWHATVEREIMKDTLVRLSYVGNHGSDLEQRFSLNAQEAEYNYVARTKQAPPSNRALLRPNPYWNFLATNRTGYSNTHSAQAELERRYSNGLGFQFFYVFTRSLTTADSGGFTSGAYFGAFNSTNGAAEVPENIHLLGEPSLSYDQRLRLIYYNSTNVPAHRLRYNGVYDLPFGREKRFGTKMNKAVDAVVGGWQVAFLGDWRGGFWKSLNPALYTFADPTLTSDQRVEMDINGRHQRLWFKGFFDPSSAKNVTGGDLNSLVPVNPSQRVARPLGPNFDNRVPLQLANGTLRSTSITGTLNPNSKAFFPGPGLWNADVSLVKNFKFTERYKARISADFFNVFNHPNDIDPNDRTGLQDLSRQFNDPRIIQLSLRFDW